MEDLDLVAAMQGIGRVAIIPLEATTSARRYLSGGVWRTVFAHWFAAAAWALHVDRDLIARWLRR